MDVPKRNFQQTSPDIFDARSPKKFYTYNRMSQNVDIASSSAATLPHNVRPTPTAPNMNCFSWDVFDEKLNNALDLKLENVVKKEDLTTISTDIQNLRLENIRLQKELQTVKNRLETVDKASRRNNIVISGLTSKFVPQALNEFNQICVNSLKTSVNVVEARLIASGKSLLVALNSPLEVKSVLSKRQLLKGTNVFIDKDYTTEERNNRFFLRQIGKKVKSAEKNVKIRYGDSRIFIADKPFSCNGDKIIAVNNADASYLRQLLSKVNFVSDIMVRDFNKTNNNLRSDASNVLSSN